MIEAWFDGCCEPKNPGGHAAYGVVIRVDGQTVLEEGGYVGVGPKISNNVAEYAGVIRLLEEIAKIPGVAIIRGDSKLVIFQLAGKWKVATPTGLYVPYFYRAQALANGLRSRIKFEHVYRDKNAECDRLSKKVLLDRGIEFRIQPEAAA